MCSARDEKCPEGKFQKSINLCCQPATGAGLADESSSLCSVQQLPCAACSGLTDAARCLAGRGELPPTPKEALTGESERRSIPAENAQESPTQTENTGKKRGPGSTFEAAAAVAARQTHSYG
ncbi:unnamed protein product [Menidia menidia]|uniref:(Atlantic silverside) hypothetical protein n=1 Tax=Menidia menidia TaxID=238744 RepID=A0A8S4BGF7_9TELE|nr:unnamed protein product [Menidia menidia]